MKIDIVRAWKDETYRLSLSEEELKDLPINPAGELELTDVELISITGGAKSMNKGNDCPPVPVPVPGTTPPLLAIISNIHLFSVNILANPFNQTCLQARV